MIIHENFTPYVTNVHSSWTEHLAVPPPGDDDRKDRMDILLSGVTAVDPSIVYSKLLFIYVPLSADVTLLASSDEVSPCIIK